MSLFRKKADSVRVPYTSAVIVAAGSASRMEGVDKILAPIGLEPVIVHAARPFQESALIHEIVIVTREDLLVEVSRAVHDAGLDKVKMVVVGGETRTASVSAGLDAVSKKTKLAAIHDGARPFVTTELIDRTVREAGISGAAAPAVPVKDTIKTASRGVVTSTPERSSLFAVQTPQVFDFDLLRGAIVKAQQDRFEATDDCALVEHLGMSVRLTEGAEENLKLTTPLDLAVAQLIFDGREADAYRLRL